VRREGAILRINRPRASLVIFERNTRILLIAKVRALEYSQEIKKKKKKKN
jgi:hypothetical protein